MSKRRAVLKIGDEHPVFIIAEISSNHGQDYNRAVKLIRKAKECGVDAVKFQTYTPDSLTIDVNNKYFQVKHPKWGGQSLYELYKKAYTPWKWFKKLKKITDDLNLGFFSTAYDRSSVDLLEEIDVPIHKIASFELVDLPLIEYMAKTKKPMIISTGMGTISEIEDAVRTARSTGVKDLTLLKCVSSYPAKPDDMNLNTIPHLKKMFNCTVGLSDHTLGIGVSIASVSLGAKVVEKHFTDSRKYMTPDNFFSIEPHELKDLVDNIRTIEQAMGEVHYGLTKDEEKTHRYRRSLFAVKDIQKGEQLTEDNIRSIRPSNGLKPKYYKKILGKKVKKKISKGTPITWDII